MRCLYLLVSSSFHSDMGASNNCVCMDPICVYVYESGAVVAYCDVTYTYTHLYENLLRLLYIFFLLFQL